MDEIQATHVDAQRNQASKNHPHQFRGQYPIKVNELKHLFYEVSEAEKTAKLFTQAMVFEETDNDETGMVFYKCGQVHHAIGLRPGKACQRPENVEALKVEHLDLEVDTMDIDLRTCDFPKENKIPAASQGREGSGERRTIFFVTQMAANSSYIFSWIK